MKKTIIATAAALMLASNASAEFSSTWILDRTIITDDYKVFDTALDDNIIIGGVMKIVNDSYELKGLMCDERTLECLNITESLEITAMDYEGLWADVTEENGHDSTVHIMNRTPRSDEPLTILFRNNDWGSTVTHSFRLIGHNEELPDYTFENGVGILEGKMILDQIHANQ